MARTDEGEALTERHRQGQIALRAGALRDFIRLWPIWQGDDQTFATLVAATVPLVTVHRQISATFAAAYFDAFRRLEQAPGDAAARLPEPLDVAKLEAALHVTGRIATRNAIVAGQAPRAAMQTALVRTSGAVGTDVLDGGRETLTLSAEGDRHARGWQRVASGKACAFCALLAARGPVYSESGARFQAHGHCACGVEPVYDGAALPPTSSHFRALYQQATREASANGDLTRGTTNDALNAFRRALAAQT